LVLERDGRPEVRGHGHEAAETLGHHADHVERRAVHENRSREHGRIAREILHPRAVAQDDDPLPAGVVVHWRERPSACRARAQDLEEVAGDECSLEPLALDPRVDVRSDRERGREDARLADERVVLGPRVPRRIRRRRAWARDRHELVRMANGVRKEDERVE
jgi:hypothetical protein